MGHASEGAHDQIRTGDLVLTKNALCRLSYVGRSDGGRRLTASPPSYWQANASGWWGQDSNLRIPSGSRIYSPVPLTTRPPHPGRSRRWDSNPQPAVYKTAALPIELRRQEARSHVAPAKLYGTFANGRNRDARPARRRGCTERGSPPPVLGSDLPPAPRPLAPAGKLAPQVVGHVR